MEYVTLMAFGALGLAFAAFGHLSLTRSRRAIEAAEQRLHVQPSQTGQVKTTREAPLKISLSDDRLTMQSAKARPNRTAGYSPRRSGKFLKAK